jgi:hypothetical protein
VGGSLGWKPGYHASSLSKRLWSGYVMPLCDSRGPVGGSLGWKPGYHASSLSKRLWSGYVMPLAHTRTHTRARTNHPARSIHVAHGLTPTHATAQAEANERRHANGLQPLLVRFPCVRRVRGGGRAGGRANCRAMRTNRVFCASSARRPRRRRVGLRAAAQSGRSDHITWYLAYKVRLLHAAPLRSRLHPRWDSSEAKRKRLHGGD